MSFSKAEQYSKAINIGAGQGFKPAIDYVMQEPDWSDSKSIPSETWKNPLITMQTRLEVADGTYTFQLNIIKNKNKRIKELEQTIVDLTERIRVLEGIE